MSYVSIIKKEGFKYFFNAILNEVKKKLFVLRNSVFHRGHNRLSYSQYAEDLFIENFFGYKKSGYYIDIGANHPEILSNTKKFYDMGWRGVNVEPNTILYNLFLKERPGDINFNVGVGNVNGELIFYSLDPDTLSTFEEDAAIKLIEDGSARLIEKKEIKIMKLLEVFHQIGERDVDFLSIDVEGYDMEVLKSNDWNKYRPRLVCVEDGSGKKFCDFFKNVGYKKIGNNGLNTFFSDKLLYDNQKD